MCMFILRQYGLYICTNFESHPAESKLVVPNAMVNRPSHSDGARETTQTFSSVDGSRQPQTPDLRSPPPPPPPVLVFPVASPVAATLLDPHELQRLPRAAHALEWHEARAHALRVAAAVPLAGGAPLQAVLAHADAVHEAYVHLAGAARGGRALVATLEKKKKNAHTEKVRHCGLVISEVTSHEAFVCVCVCVCVLSLIHI